MINKVRPIAIYLPQFHPIPENDAAWGEGFTEWSNVRKAKPLFKSHCQPHVPHDTVGYYDLRDSYVMVQQATLARKFGIYGFAFYHYWFNGNRLLDFPLNNMLRTGKPEFPFCYIWANESWNKKWYGQDNEIIVKQNYSFDDDRSHIIYLCENVFADKRYITVNNKPFFIVYKPFLFPDIRTTIQIWRDEVSKTRFKEIYIASMDNFLMGQKPDELGFDATIHFQPDYRIFNKRLLGNSISRLLHKVKIKTSPFLQNYIYDYEEYSKIAFNYYLNINHKCFPGIMPGWDNSARRNEGALIFSNSSADKYKNWLVSILNNYKGYNSEENFLFINAWNEWAEGNHLEPCQKWGDAYLRMTKQVLTEA
jgi:lipopolysaccharide biosynthesis protein